MAHCEWDESFSVNVSELDNQHQQLFQLISSLYEAWRKGCKESTNDCLMEEMSLQYKVLDELVEYTEYHLSTEEKYMEQYQYPEYDLHRREHEQFKQEVMTLLDDLRSGREVTTPELIRFLIEWWKNHIMGSDKKYASHFNKCGLY